MPESTPTPVPEPAPTIWQHILEDEPNNLKLFIKGFLGKVEAGLMLFKKNLFWICVVLGIAIAVPILKAMAEAKRLNEQAALVATLKAATIERDIRAVERIQVAHRQQELAKKNWAEWEASFTVPWKAPPVCYHGDNFANLNEAPTYKITCYLSEYKGEAPRQRIICTPGACSAHPAEGTDDRLQ